MEATRRSFNKDFLLALAADFKKHGAAAIEKVRKQQPAAYMKICALLVRSALRARCDCQRASDLYDRPRVSWRILAASTQLVYAKTLLKRRLESAMNSMLAHCKNAVCDKSC